MIDFDARDRVAIRSVYCQSRIHIEALQSGVSTFVFESMKRFGRATLPDDFWVHFIRSTSFFPPNFGQKIRVRLVLKSGWYSAFCGITLKLDTQIGDDDLIYF